MTPEQIIASTIWAEDRGGGADGMAPIAGVILNRAATPGWWGKDAVGVCLCHGQFDGWNWNDPNFRPMLTADETDPSYALALSIARQTLSGEGNAANGADHYFAKSMAGHPPDWAFFNPPLLTAARTPCYESPNHYFYKIGLGA